MDATVVVAAFGVGGTLAGSLFSPVLGERSRRKTAREDRLAVQRIDAYADYLRMTSSIAMSYEVTNSINVLDVHVPTGTR